MLALQRTRGNQYVQRMFPGSSKRRSTAVVAGPIDVVKTPSPAGPVPIPYPNIGKVAGKRGRTKKRRAVKPPKLATPKPKADMVVGKMVSMVSAGLAGSKAKAMDTAAKAGAGQLAVTQQTWAKTEQFVEETCKAYARAVDSWRLQAYFSGITIMGLSAIGGPGCLNGPSFAEALSGAGMPASPEGTGDWSGAIKSGLGDSFDQWSSKVAVPGLPWYPSFAFWPGPMAPPIPNVPFPLIAMPSSGASAMSQGSLKAAFVSNYGRADDQATTVFGSIATGVSMAFMQWLASQQVIGVIGRGPVPGFAPPFVPGGPVVGGDVLPIPGALST